MGTFEKVQRSIVKQHDYGHAECNLKNTENLMKMVHEKNLEDAKREYDELLKEESSNLSNNRT